jgi:hypothetical protein
VRPPPSVSKVSASGTLWTEKIIQCFEEFSAKGIDASLFKLDDEPTTIDFLNTLDGHMMKYQRRQTHNNSGKNVCESNLCRKKMKGSSIFIQIDTFLDEYHLLSAR